MISCLSNDDLFLRFSSLFFELDGDTSGQRPEVTRACIKALFDRLLNPPESEEDNLQAPDIDATLRTLIGLLEAEAEEMRQWIATQRAADDSAQTGP